MEKKYLEFKSPAVAEQARRDLEREPMLDKRSTPDAYWAEAEQLIKELNYSPWRPQTELRNLQRLKKSGQETRNASHLQRLTLREFLPKQEQVIGQTISDLRAIFGVHLELDYDELLAIVKKRAPAGRLNAEQLVIFIQALKDYETKHARVEEYVKKHSPAELFKICFGREPRGQVEAVKGAMTITLRLFDSDDYALAFYYSRLNGDFSKLTLDHKQRANNSLGAALGTVQDQNLADVINIANAPKLTDPVLVENHRIHEEQHQINKLFRVVEARLSSLAIIKKIISRQPDVQIALSEIYHELVRLERKRLNIDCLARDEILAYYLAGAQTEQIYKALTTSPFYDYQKFYAQQIQDLPRQVASNLDKFLQVVAPGANPAVIQESGQEVLIDELKPVQADEQAIKELIKLVFEKEYQEDLKRWLQSITILEKKGQERREIVNLLYQSPANRWLHVARRAANLVKFDDLVIDTPEDQVL